MSFAIPALAVTPPWMLCDQGQVDSSSGIDPRLPPIIPCGTIYYKETISSPDWDEMLVTMYYRACYPCGTYKSGNPIFWDECNTELNY